MMGRPTSRTSLTDGEPRAPRSETEPKQTPAASVFNVVNSTGCWIPDNLNCTSISEILTSILCTQEIRLGKESQPAQVLVSFRSKTQEFREAETKQTGSFVTEMAGNRRESDPRPNSKIDTRESRERGCKSEIAQFRFQLSAPISEVSEAMKK